MIDENSIAKKIISVIRSIAGNNDLYLHEPLFFGNEWSYLKNCLDTTYVSSVGKYVNEFEEKISDFTGSKFVVAVVNGTSALHIGLKLCGVVPKDEVLVPSFTFVGTVNSISYNNAIPHFVDIEQETLGIDTKKLLQYLYENTYVKNGICINKLTGRIIRAIIPVHTFGHPSNLDDLITISKKFKIKLIEDAAESLGSFFKGKHTGTFGDLGVISFNGNKTITTGNGGAILTNSYDLAKRARHLTTTAKVPHKWEYLHDEIGYNYRMSNVNAAIGCAQLENLKTILLSKRKLYEVYSNKFSKISELTLFKEPSNCESNYWLQTIILKNENKKELEVILSETNKNRIFTRPAWKLISELKPYQDCPKMDLTCSKSLSKRVINIPSSPNILRDINNNG